MPYKHNEVHRHKIEPVRYKVTNWPEYNKALRNRGNFTVYFTEEAVDGWHTVKTGSRSSPQKYSDLAIEVSLMIRQAFHLPLRQTQGFMKSLVTAMSSDLQTSAFSACIICEYPVPPTRNKYE